MTRLNVLLLGPPEVLWGNTPVNVKRRTPRALLYFIASQGKPVAREELLEAFWGEVSEDSRSQLRVALSRLRSDLPDADLLITQSNWIKLDPDRVWVDQHHFEQLIQQAGKLIWRLKLTEPLPPHQADLLAQAAALWRGDMFLSHASIPGTPYLDRWLTETNQHLSRLRESILERLAGHAYACSEWEEALQYARAALRLDPFNNRLHHLALKSLAEMGRIQQVQEYYHQLKEQYRQELGITPGRRVQELVQAIEQQRHLTAPQTLPAWKVHQAFQAGFVGRARERALIKTAIEHHQSVIVLGESGAGKTRLLQHITNSAQSYMRVLVTTCKPLEATIPLQPLSDVLRSALHRNHWINIPTSWLTVLVHLIPEAREFLHREKPALLPTDPSQASSLLMEAIRQAFLVLSQEIPLWLVLDDAQWADEATLNTLAYLAARPPFRGESNLTVLARNEELPPYAARWLEAMRQSGESLILHLSGLAEQETRDLISDVLGILPSPRFVQRLHRFTGGNPLFILEVLESLARAEEEVDFSGEKPLPLSEDLRYLLQARIRQVSPAAREALNAAAVIGTRFSLSSLRHTSRLDTNTLPAALAELENRGLVRAESHADGDAQYTFVHDSIKEVTEQSIPADEACKYHLRVAQYLEENQPATAANLLAAHYQAAGDIPSAFLYWLKAGDAAVGLAAFPEARRAYQRARALLDHPEAQKIPIETILRLFKHWNEILYNVNDTAGLLELGNDAISLGQRRNSEALLGVGHDILSDAAFTRNDFPRGLEETEAAIHYLQETDCRDMLIEAYNHHSVFLYMSGRIPEAVSILEEALSLEHDIQSREGFRYRSHTHYQLALMRCFQGQPAQGSYHARMAIEDAEAISSATALTTGHSIAALALQYLGEYAAALRHALRSIELGEQSRGVRMLGYTYAYAAMSALGLGRIEAALAYARQAQHIGEKHGYADVYALGCSQAGSVYSRLGMLARAREIFESGFQKASEHFSGVYNLFLLGGVLYRLGEVDTGLSLLAQAEQGMASFGIELGAFLARSVRAAALAAGRDWEQAEPQAREVLAQAEKAAMRPQSCLAHNILAGAARARGDDHLSRIHSHKALAFARQMDSPWGEIEALSTLLVLDADNPAARRLHQEQLNQIYHRLRSQIHTPELQNAFHNWWETLSSRLNC